MALIKEIKPGAAAPWRETDEVLRSLLYPLWGEQIEAGKKISTANYIQSRTADGKGRLFPRTLVQLIMAAVHEEKRQRSSRVDRVLRSASIQADFGQQAAARRPHEGVQRFEALSNSTPRHEVDGDTRKIIRYLTTRVKKSARDVEAGALLHTGPAGWKEVIVRLVDVGVLSEYKRARSEKGEPKYQVALLYRPAIGIKTYGGL